MSGGTVAMSTNLVGTWRYEVMYDAANVDTEKFSTEYVARAESAGVKKLSHTGQITLMEDGTARAYEFDVQEGALFEIYPEMEPIRLEYSFPKSTLFSSPTHKVIDYRWRVEHGEGGHPMLVLVVMDSDAQAGEPRIDGKPGRDVMSAAPLAPGHTAEQRMERTEELLFGFTESAQEVASSAPAGETSSFRIHMMEPNRVTLLGDGVRFAYERGEAALPPIERGVLRTDRDIMGTWSYTYMEDGEHNPLDVPLPSTPASVPVNTYFIVGELEFGADGRGVDTLTYWKNMMFEDGDESLPPRELCPLPSLSKATIAIVMEFRTSWALERHGGQHLIKTRVASVSVRIGDILINDLSPEEAFLALPLEGLQTRELRLDCAREFVEGMRQGGASQETFDEQNESWRKLVSSSRESLIIDDGTRTLEFLASPGTSP